ncbi:hypothetical protein AAGS40_17080 [Paraburkholderia sp. PREW-6R]|uniref:hypothetical protein n=1 Tax=Paraburkholderia sp. PREW-6R TaxID=3141544 RepID=UPI0031F5BE50
MSFGKPRIFRRTLNGWGLIPGVIEACVALSAQAQTPAPGATAPAVTQALMQLRSDYLGKRDLPPVGPAAVAVQQRGAAEAIGKAPPTVQSFEAGTSLPVSEERQSVNATIATIAANVATADQTDGAARLQLYSSVARVHAPPRPAVLLSDMKREKNNRQ